MCVNPGRSHWRKVNAQVSMVVIVVVVVVVLFVFFGGGMVLNRPIASEPRGCGRSIQGDPRSTEKETCVWDFTSEYYFFLINYVCDECYLTEPFSSVYRHLVREWTFVVVNIFCAWLPASLASRQK